jgi:hypothetical protein
LKLLICDACLSAGRIRKAETGRDYMRRLTQDIIIHSCKQHKETFREPDPLDPNETKESYYTSNQLFQWYYEHVHEKRKQLMKTLVNLGIPLESQKSVIQK